MAKNLSDDDYNLEEQLVDKGLRVKSPALAVFLGFFLPPIGSLYVRQFIGAIFVTFFWILFFLLSLFLPLFIFSMPIFNLACACSCYNAATKINRNRVGTAIDSL